MWCLKRIRTLTLPSPTTKCGRGCSNIGGSVFCLARVRGLVRARKPGEAAVRIAQASRTAGEGAGTLQVNRRYPESASLGRAILEGVEDLHHLSVARLSNVILRHRRRIYAQRFFLLRRPGKSLRVDPSSPACAWLCRDDKRVSFTMYKQTPLPPPEAGVGA